MWANVIVGILFLILAYYCGTATESPKMKKSLIFMSFGIMGTMSLYMVMAYPHLRLWFVMGLIISLMMMRLTQEDEPDV